MDRTFADASLVAAGSGLLLGAVLATEARLRRRACVGLAGFLALELATFVRYTNVVVLGCAVVVVLVLWRLRAVGLPLRMLSWWLASPAPFAVGIAVFDDLVYGGPLKSGYQPGEVTCSLGAIRPNLRLIPPHLIQAMPMLDRGRHGVVLPRRMGLLRHVRRRRCPTTAVASRLAHPREA